MGRFGRRSHSGFLAPLSYWEDYKDDMEDAHGGDRFDLENSPFFSSLWRYKAARQRAEDYYSNTGKDDYYGDRYGGALNALVSDLQSPLPGVRLPRMAKSLTQLYGADVEEEISWEKSSRYDPSDRMMHEYGTSKKRKHYR